MSAVQLLPRYAYDDYVQREGKWELIYGIPYATAPAPVHRHQYISANLASEFRMPRKDVKNVKYISH